jgi:hypothetical protein
MFRVLLIMGFLLTLSACMPGYKWVNTDFSEDEMRDQYVLDKGQCMQVAGQTYPDPYPVQNPDELYYECMAYSSRRETYPIRTEDGDIEYRTVTRRANPWQCRPPREMREAYREYQNELRSMQMYRARHVNSCMSVMGWERIKIELEQ